MKWAKIVIIFLTALKGLSGYLKCIVEESDDDSWKHFIGVSLDQILWWFLLYYAGILTF